MQYKYTGGVFVILYRIAFACFLVYPFGRYKRLKSL